MVPFVTFGTDLYISEFVAKNASTLVNEFDEAEDWIEIYNDSAQSVNLAGWYMTDSASQLTKWTFPSVSRSEN